MMGERGETDLAGLVRIALLLVILLLALEAVVQLFGLVFWLLELLQPLLLLAVVAVAVLWLADRL